MSPFSQADLTPHGGHVEDLVRQLAPASTSASIPPAPPLATNHRLCTPSKPPSSPAPRLLEDKAVGGEERKRQQTAEQKRSAEESREAGALPHIRSPFVREWYL